MTKAQASVFSLVLAVGAGSTWFTFKHLKKEHETLSVDESGNIQQPVVEEPVAPTPPPVDPEPKITTKPNAPEPAKPGQDEMRTEMFHEPEQLLGAFAEFAKSRNVDSFLELAGPDAIDAETLPRLVELLENPDYEPPAVHPVVPLAKISGGERWAIRFQPVESNAAAPDSAPANGNAPPTTGAATTGAGVEAGSAPASTTPSTDPLTGTPAKPAVKLILPERLITFELRQPDKKSKLLEISEIRVPDPLKLDPNSPNALPPSTDSVTVAHYFAKAVLSGDFKTARALSDPDKITDERIAALMIAVEEGGYSLHDSKPLTQTLERDTVSWIIAKVKNADVVSEFGIEMSRPDPEEDPSKGWRIDSMSFDKIIQIASTAGGGGGVAYAPIVKNPQGGDSLVLFFDFDGDELNVRAMRQVEIIASILKKNPARQITINGHADALGLDDYNARLSARRAAAVKKALTGLGVAIDQVITKGYGETAPLSPNFKEDGSDNPSGRSQNRRTEVYLNF